MWINFANKDNTNLRSLSYFLDSTILIYMWHETSHSRDAICKAHLSDHTKLRCLNWQTIIWNHNMVGITLRLYHVCLFMWTFVVLFLNGRRIYGGVYTFTICFDFWLCSLRYENDFLQVLSKLSQASMVKIFQISGRWFCGTPKGGVQPP